MNKRSIQSYTAGFLSCAVILGSTAYAAPIKKGIEVLYNNIKIVVDGKQINPKDVKGNKVEPFIYNGTTYLPARALAEALGKEVSWDEKNSTVYIGKPPVTVSSAETVMTVNGEKISVAEFQEIFNAVVLQMGSQSSQNYTQQAKEKTIEILTSTKVQLQKAKELGIVLTGAEKDAVKKELETNITEMGAQEFQNWLTEAKWTKETQLKVMEQQKLMDKLAKTLVEPEFEKAYKDQIKVSHILFLTVDEMNQPYSEAKQAEVKKKAQEVLGMVKQGQDFNQLVEQYNEDPGLKANGGAYIFGKGEMVQEFEVASYALGEGKVTNEPIKTAYGFHIIKRLSKTEQDKEKARNQYYDRIGSQIYQDKAWTWINTAKVDKNQGILDRIIK